MAKAYWNGAVLAESDTYEMVEGNVYFPAASIDRQYFRESSTHTVCPWKGTASYHSIEVDGQVNKDAAWYYPDPQAGGSKYQGLCRLLARRQGREVATVLRACFLRKSAAA